MNATRLNDFQCVVFDSNEARKCSFKLDLYDCVAKNPLHQCKHVKLYIKHELHNIYLSLLAKASCISWEIRRERKKCVNTQVNLLLLCCIMGNVVFVISEHRKSIHSGHFENACRCNKKTWITLWSMWKRNNAINRSITFFEYWKYNN